MNKKSLQRLSLITLIIGLIVLAIAYYFFHFVTDSGFTLTFHEEAGKPFVTDLIGIFGVLFIWSSAISFIFSLVFFSEEKNDFEHQCRTYFSVKGEFDVESFLQKTELKADKIVKKGEINEKSRLLAECDEIKIGFNNSYDVNINVMIRKTIKDLLPKSDILAQFKKENNLEYYLVLVPEIATISDEPKQLLSLESDIIDFLHKTETAVDLDYYVY